MHMADSPVIESSEGRVRVRGAVTLETVQTLLAQSHKLLEGGDVRVDLSGVSEADSSAVALMLAWARDAAARSIRISFENCSENLRTLIGLYDVGELLA
jgi:phospholipid transport system transporter-binding protein